LYRDYGHEQLISNGERLKPAFAERDKKQKMIDLRGISTNWFKTQLCPTTIHTKRMERGAKKVRTDFLFSGISSLKYIYSVHSL
jgi:hypothetical protein